MFTRQSESFVKIANVVKRMTFLKPILKPLYETYVSFLQKNRNAKFKKNGLRIISEFDKCLCSNNITYTLAFGSMLGAVREKGFIKHDFDLDVAIWNDDYSTNIPKILKQAGFKLFHSITVDNGKLGREETYEKDGVAIDVFYIYEPIDKYPYCCDFIAFDGALSFDDSMKKFGGLITRRLQLPWEKNIIRVPFETIELPICKNANQILQFRYGEDYMIPNPKWTYTGKNNYISVWENQKGKINH